MQYFLLSLFLTIVTPLQSFSGDRPAIFIESGDAFDFQCAQMVPQNGVSESETKQVAKLVPTIQKLWNELGQSLLANMEEAVSKKFKRSELSVTLITCRAVIAVSHPTVINMKPFLKMGINGNEPILIDTIFHELAHRFLDEHFSEILDPSRPKATKLIKKYKNEGAVVIAHIHLFALQKYTYQKAKRMDDWKKAEKFMRSIGEPNYIKALDIVSSESENKFVDELK